MRTMDRVLSVFPGAIQVAIKFKQAKCRVLHAFTGEICRSNSTMTSKRKGRLYYHYSWCFGCGRQFRCGNLFHSHNDGLLRYARDFERKRKKPSRSKKKGSTDG